MLMYRMADAKAGLCAAGNPHNKRSDRNRPASSLLPVSLMALCRLISHALIKALTEQCQ